MKLRDFKQYTGKALATLLLAVVCFACDDPYEDSVYQIYDSNPISTTLEADSTYSEWVKILRYSNMFNALNQADECFTAFVPDDEAVTAFYAKKHISSIEEMGVDYARALVSYHIVKDTINMEDFIITASLQNISGDQINIAIDSVNAGQAVLNGEARVTEMGIRAYNGLIYVLADVLTPLVETVYDRVAENESYSLLKEAIDATGWNSSLDILADTTYLDGMAIINNRFYTLLGVSNATFAQAGINNLSDLKSKLGADENVTDTTNALFEFVAYHIMEGEYMLSDLQTFSGSDTTRIWDTAAENQILTVTIDTLAPERYFLNLLGEKACFVTEKCNVLAKNGYVHEVDAYLPVWEPQPATVVWDLADYTDVKNMVSAEDYQPKEPVSSESKTNISTASCYTIEVSEAGVGNTSYSYVTYVTCKNNLKKAVNYDRVVFNVGYMGTVSMKTPTIVRGKYKMEVDLVSLSDHSFMWKLTDGNGGMLKISIDDENVTNVAPYTVVSSQVAGVYTATLYSEIEFDTTAPHTFKFVVMDPAASTNNKFSLQFDCITFTPITEN